MGEIKTTNRQILVNAVRTPDGTILRSRHVHDFRSYVDANGHTYEVDGGTSYLSRGWSSDAPPAEDISVYVGDPHERIREVWDWETRGINGDQPPNLIKLRDMETAHIVNILNSPVVLSGSIFRLFVAELNHRGVSWDVVTKTSSKL